MKYIQILDKKRKTEIIVQVGYKKEKRYFIASDDIVNGNDLITKIKEDNSLIDEVLEDKKKIETTDWILLPINFSSI